MFWPHSLVKLSALLQENQPQPQTIAHLASFPLHGPSGQPSGLPILTEVLECQATTDVEALEVPFCGDGLASLEQRGPRNTFLSRETRAYQALFSQRQRASGWNKAISSRRKLLCHLQNSTCTPHRAWGDLLQKAGSK